MPDVTASTFVERWGAGWGSRDEEALGALLAHDAVIHIGGMDGPTRGREAYAAQVGLLLGAVPDLDSTITAHAVNGDVAFFSYYAHGTAQHGPMELLGIGWYRLGPDGLVVEGYDMVDTGVYQQAHPSALPPEMARTVAPGAGGDGPERFLNGLSRYWDDQSYEVTRPLLADDIVAWWPGETALMRGADHLIARTIQRQRELPDLTIEQSAYATNGDVVFIGWQGARTVDGAPLPLRGACRYRVGEDGRAHEALMIYDTLAA